MNLYLDFFLKALAVGLALALAFNIHKYGLDPTLTAIKKGLGLAEDTVVADAKNLGAFTGREFDALRSEIAQLIAGHTKSVISAVNAAAPGAPAGAIPAVPIAAVPQVQLVPVTAAAAFALSIVASLGAVGFRSGLSWNQVAYLKAMPAAVFGEWCHAFSLLDGAAAAPGAPGDALGWVTGLSDAGQGVLSAIVQQMGYTMPDTDPR